MFIKKRDEILSLIFLINERNKKFPSLGNFKKRMRMKIRCKRNSISCSVENEKVSRNFLYSFWNILKTSLTMHIHIISIRSEQGVQTTKTTLSSSKRIKDR